MIRKIVQYPEQILRMPCTSVDVFDNFLVKLTNDMISTMRYSVGCGLAAPQIGVSKRVIVVDNNMKSIVMINPRITRKSAQQSTLVEGCLSLGDKQVEITRPMYVDVQFQDLRGELCYMSIGGFLSHVVQHEIDHLNGILITDYDQGE